MDEKAAIPTLDLGHAPKGGPKGGPHYLGIYKLEGDTLLWSYNLGGRGDAVRPTDFKPAGPTHTTMKFRRVKEAKK